MKEQEDYFYFNGEIKRGGEISISPFDRGFQFADGIYETLRWDSGKLFKLDAHVKRLERSLREIKINFSRRDGFPKGFNDLESIISELVRVNNFPEPTLLVYLQITRGAFYPRQHFFPPKDIQPTVFVSVTPMGRNTKALNEGVKVILEEDIRWTRCDIKSISLLPNILARQKAVEKNAAEAVFVRDGYITEGTHTNFLGVKNGRLHTAPLSGFILAGVTREVVIDICRKENIPVVEEPIAQNELNSYDEFMITGTISEVTPVVQIDEMKVRDGKPGKITLEIQGILTRMMFG
jgi:D-alanine transaminase